MGRSRYTLRNDGVPYFHTCTIVGWLPVFTRAEAVQIVLDSFRYLQQEGFQLYGYVILENHLHFISCSERHSEHLRRFKSYTARCIIDLLKSRNDSLLLRQLACYRARHKQGNTYGFWQEGSHPQEIQGEAMMRQKLEYIHHNPVKRGYVEEAAHWRYSSARDYEGQSGLIEISRAW